MVERKDYFEINPTDLIKHRPLAQWYIDYLDSPIWKKFREIILAIDKNKCTKCGTKDKLTIHHITYERVTVELILDLITLCKDCHMLVHKATEIPFAERIYDNNYKPPYLKNKSKQSKPSEEERKRA